MDAAFERIGLSVFFESQSTRISKDMVLESFRSASLAERFRPCGSFFSCDFICFSQSVLV